MDVIVNGAGALILLFSGHHFLFLLLFPLLVEGFLAVGEEAVDLLVRVLLDGAAGTSISTAVAGGIMEEAVHDDVAVDEDDLHLKDLIFIELELFFQHFKLADGSFGGRVFWEAGLLLLLGIGVDGLGVHQVMYGQGA